MNRSHISPGNGYKRATYFELVILHDVLTSKGQRKLQASGLFMLNTLHRRKMAQKRKKEHLKFGGNTSKNPVRNVL